MDYKGFTITYDHKDANCIYRVEDDRTISWFPNFYWAAQYVKLVSQQLSKKTRL